MNPFLVIKDEIEYLYANEQFITY